MLENYIVLINKVGLLIIPILIVFLIKTPKVERAFDDDD